MFKYKAINTGTGETHNGTASVLANILNVHSSTINKASLTGHKVGGAWRIERTDRTIGKRIKKREELKTQKRVCEYCKSVFVPHATQQIYCETACAQAVYTLNKRKAREIEKQKEKQEIKPKQSVTEIAVAARQAGMTYGQYVAKMGL